jgi:hypothetical protein
VPRNGYKHFFSTLFSSLEQPQKKKTLKLLIFAAFQKFLLHLKNAPQKRRAANSKAIELSPNKGRLIKNICQSCSLM